MVGEMTDVLSFAEPPSIPLHRSLSGGYVEVWDDITYTPGGTATDPRSIFTPQFQLLPPDADAFGPWADGTWESTAPSGGPYAADIGIGAGQPPPVDPGMAGAYILWGQLEGDDLILGPYEVCSIVLEAL
jgi:hypothetical protein